MGRATQGVRLIRLDENDQIASVAQIDEIVVDEIEALSESAIEGDVTDIANLPIEPNGEDEEPKTENGEETPPPTEQ